MGFGAKTIRTRLLLLQAGIVGMMVLGAVALWYLNIEPGLRLIAAKEQAEITQRFAAEIGAFVRARVQALQTAAQMGRLWQEGLEAQEESLQRLLQLSPEITELSLVDASGQELLRLSRLRVTTEDDLRIVKNLPAIKAAIAGRSALGQVYHLATREPHVTVAVPLTDAASAVRAIVKAELNLKSFWAAVPNAKIGQKGFLYIVDGRGDLIAHPDFSKVLSGANFAQVPTVKAFLSHPGKDADLGVVVVGASGEEVMSTAASIPGTDWAVIGEEPATTALSHAQRIKSIGASILLLAVLGALAASHRFGKRISGPLDVLGRGAAVIARGDLDYRINVRTGDEFEALGEKFNHMAGDLNESYRSLEKKVGDRTKELSALYSSLAPLSKSRSLQEVLNGAIGRLLEVTAADASLIRLKADGDGKLTCPAHRGFDEFYLESTADPAPGSAVHSVLSTGEPVISPDIVADARFKGKMLISAGFRSCALLPLVIDGKVQGVMHVASKALGHFHDEKLKWLMTIARHLSITVENHQLLLDIQRNLERIGALHEIDKAIAGSLELKTVLQVLLEKITLFLPYPAATAIRLINHDSGLLEPVCCRDLDEEAWKMSRGGRGIPNLVAASRTPLTIVDVLSDPRTRDRDFFAANQLISFLGVPLLAKGEVLGVLSFYTRKPHLFKDEEIEFLTTLADQAAIAIHNSKLYSDLQAQADALKKSNNVKSGFLGIMSHELTTPITAIMGYAALIQEEIVGPANDEQKRSAQVIRHKGKELLGMIRGILEATKLESGGVFVELGEVDSRRLIDGLRAETEVPSGKELQLEWQTDESLPPVTTDEYKLKQVLKQLIDNAIKFTPEGTVRIRAISDPDAQALRFEVADTGVGIAPELLPVIFERFRQADSSDTRSFEGLGLGLYLAKKYCDLLGANLSAKSEVGKGSTFALTLPCIDPALSSVPSTSPNPPPMQESAEL